jgi:hypothetical protein
MIVQSKTTQFRKYTMSIYHNEDMLINTYQEVLNQKLLELSIAKTFAKIKLESIANEQSSDNEEIKKQKKIRLLGMSQWGLKLQSDLENMKKGEYLDKQSETTQKIVNSELDRVLHQNNDLSSIIKNIETQLQSAKDILSV